MAHMEPGLKYLSWHYIAGAVLDVFRENQRREGSKRTPFKASADVWVLDSELRADIHARACRFWCKRTGLDHSYFPFAETCVARLYFKFRKRGPEEVEAWAAEIAAASSGTGQQPLFTDCE